MMLRDFTSIGLVQSILTSRSCTWGRDVEEAEDRVWSNQSEVDEEMLYLKKAYDQSSKWSRLDFSNLQHRDVVCSEA